MQHGKITIWENATWKKCNMEIMQLDKSATQKECNTRKVQHEKSVTWKNWSMKKVTRVKNGEKKCTRIVHHSA